MLDHCVSGPFCVTTLASLEWLKQQTFIISHYLWTRNWPWFTWRPLPVSPWGLGVWTHWVRTQQLLYHGLNGKPQMPLRMATCNIQACFLDWGTRKREEQRERKLQYKWRSRDYTPKLWGLSNGTAVNAAKSLSHVWLSATPWRADYQATPSMGFSRQEYWCGSPVPSLSNG